MTIVPAPLWPVLVLAAIEAADGILSIGPAPFIRENYIRIGFPSGWWWMTPTVKFAATAGLIAGIWIPGLGLVTGCALILYFLVAIGMHIRARNFGHDLFLNATAMLLICVAVTLFGFVI